MKCLLSVMACAVLLGGLSFFALAEPAENFSVSNVYGSNMVLQRDVPIRITGKADAGKTVKIAMSGQNGKDQVEAEAEADKDGIWRVSFPAKKAGGPYSITITGAGNKSINLTDILMGDVWICSGQSNMDMPVWGKNEFYREKDGDKIAAKANDDQLRLFHVLKIQPAVKPGYKLQDDKCSWKKAVSPDAVEKFSATGYFFGVEMRKKLGVPIGLVDSSWGGIMMEAWMSYTSYRKFKGNGDAAKCRLPQTPIVTNPQSPSGLYNSMIHPFTAFPVKGVIWYQGCANIAHPEEYAVMQKYWVDGWREAWQQPEMPFVIVQLTGHIVHSPDKPLPRIALVNRKYAYRMIGFAPIREAQALMMDYPHCGVAVSIDLGDASDIHPHNKKDFAPRIVAEAMRVAYGSKEVTHGPIFQSVKFDGNRAVVSFKDAGKGLATKDGKAPQEFLLAGADKAFYPANAEIKDNTVILTSPAVDAPKYVRYAWQDYCYNANLINADGFPAFPFRTDGANGIYKGEGMPKKK